jgi:hypothetical protein
MTEMLAAIGMYPESRPGSASIPTEEVAVDPTAQRILSVFPLSASRMNPIAFAGAVKVEAAVVIAALFEMDPVASAVCTTVPMEFVPAGSAFVMVPSVVTAASVLAGFKSVLTEVLSVVSEASFETVESRARPPVVPILNVGVAAKAGRVPLMPKDVFPMEPPDCKGDPRVVLIVV